MFLIHSYTSFDLTNEYFLLMQNKTHIQSIFIFNVFKITFICYAGISLNKYKLSYI